MAINGNPKGMEGGPWPAYNTSGSFGLTIQNTTAPGFIDFSSCGVYDAMDTAQLQNASISNGNLSSSSNNSTGGNGADNGSLSNHGSSAPLTGEAILTHGRLMYLHVALCGLGALALL